MRVMAVGTVLAVACAPTLPQPSVIDPSQATPAYRVACNDEPTDCIAAASAQCAGGARTLTTRVTLREGARVCELDFDCPGATVHVEDTERPSAASWAAAMAPAAPKEGPGSPASPSASPSSAPGRKFLHALGAAMKGASAGWNAATPSQSQGPTAVSPATTTSSAAMAPKTARCSSDYECGTGEVCVKAQFAIDGTCARSVNQYGTPIYAPPRPSSVGVGQGTCVFDTDCPPSFRCEKTNGALRGNCMR